MPSPLAHSVTGYALAQLGVAGSIQKHWGTITYALFVAIAPDFDFALQLLTGENYHRGATHSLLFCLGLSAIAGIISYGVNKRKAHVWFGLTLIIYASHLLLDYLTRGGSGIQFLWPLPNYYQSPILIFPSVRHWEGLFHRSHLVFLGFETLYAVLLLTLSQWIRQKGWSTQPKP
ncbi:MAG: metal-dependent hydrolase [Cyanobacteria bacterium P01_A01_bin.123]